MKKFHIFTSVIVLTISLCSHSQTVVWNESFEPSSGITSTSCTRTNVNTLANTNCIPTNWKTGRLASSGSNQGHRWRVTSDWPMPGYGSYALDLDMQAAEGGGLLSHGTTLTAGVSYELTFYYRVPGTSGGGSYRIFVGHTTNGNQSSNPGTQVASTGNTNQNWNLATYSFTPSTTGTYYMQIYARNTSAPTQRLLIDNMTLTQSCTVPNQPSVITGDVTLCSGNNQTYSVANDPDATSYTWTLPSGFSGTSTTNSISVTAGTSGGTISVIANNTCGSSTIRSVNVTINTVPSLPSVISGTATVCENTTTTYSVTNNPSATSYTWVLPSGWSGTSTTNSIPATAGSDGGTISVVANNTCGGSQSQTMTVTVVNNVPNQPSVITGDVTLCNGGNQTYSVATDPDAIDYTWTLPSGLTGTSTTGSISVTAGTGGGIISVTANNICGSSSAQTASITITTIDNTVSDNGNTLTANETGASYQWINCTDGLDISGETNQSFTPTADGLYAVRIQKGTCSETSACITVNTLGLGMNDLVTGVSVFPNPAAEVITIRLSSLTNIGLSTVQITDLAGRVVFSQKMKVEQGDNTFVIDTNVLPQGLYNVNLFTDEVMLSTQKLIVSR